MYQFCFQSDNVKNNFLGDLEMLMTCHHKVISIYSSYTNHTVTFSSMSIIKVLILLYYI